MNCDETELSKITSAIYVGMRDSSQETLIREKNKIQYLRKKILIFLSPVVTEVINFR